MAEILKTDLCIIGAGALGTAMALKARARMISVVLVQRPGDVPGESARAELQRACLLASADRAQAMRSAGELGLTRADPKPNFRLIGERAAAIADAAAPASAADRLAALGVTVLSEVATFTDPRTLKVGAETVRAGQFVLATGSRAEVPALPGLDQIAYFTPDSILDNVRKLSHLVVIGGSALAFELAQAYARLGAGVTLVPHGPVLPGFDAELVAILLRALREEGVAILEGAQVTAILPRAQGTGIALAHADGSLATLDVSHVLVASGRVPELDPGLLGAARLKRDPLRPDHLLVNLQGRTSNRHVVAIGGAAGVYDRQTALRQAAIVLQRASGQAGGRIEPQRLVRTVSTTPPLAQIGLSDADGPLRPGQVVLRANASETEAARATGNLQGSAKLVVAGNGAIAGGAVLGEGAGETVGMLALAIERGMGVADLAGLLLPPASAAGALHDLAEQFIGQQRPSPWARRWAAIARPWR